CRSSGQEPVAVASPLALPSFPTSSPRVWDSASAQRRQWEEARFPPAAGGSSLRMSRTWGRRGRIAPLRAARQRLFGGVAMRSSGGAGIAVVLLGVLAGASGAAEPLGFAVKLDTVLEHDDGKFLWFHPRVAAVPRSGRDGKAAVVMTLQKHLRASDHY